MIKVYIAVRYDDGLDDAYSLHYELPEAKEACGKFLECYTDELGEWEEAHNTGWIYDITFPNEEDDPPNAYIVESEIADRV